MKDNLFELLLNLFETSLSQLRKSHTADQEIAEVSEEDTAAEDQLVQIRTQHHHSIRVITHDEQMKLTKASYQFLMRMRLWNVLSWDLFELIMNQLQCSDSPIVTLQETKWAIRNGLSSSLNEEQLAFLDLALYQAEDKLIVH
ncbi:DUF494 family protein [Legionella sp.]|uniref:DUF494 family protein n=1 Tax=Legionella sp. TaxID=459 RepID=UPI003CA32C02